MVAFYLKKKIKKNEMFKIQGRAEKNNTKEVRNKGRKPRKYLREGRKEGRKEG